jgi:hypothetical protein
MARTRNLRNDILWLESVRLELRAGNKSIAEQQLNRGLQECPSSGRFLACYNLFALFLFLIFYRPTVGRVHLFGAIASAQTEAVRRHQKVRARPGMFVVNFLN